VIHRIGSVCDWDGKHGFFFFTRVEDHGTAGLNDTIGHPYPLIESVIGRKVLTYVPVSEAALLKQSLLAKYFVKYK